jgi:peptidoglycan hydrolase-like protein with peptidoglycan-binding domain
MVVFTGASTSVMYGYEDVFGSANTSPANLTNTFGLNTKVSTLSLQTNRQQLNKLGQVEPTKYAYGTQAGSLSIGFVMDNSHSHKIFQSIYGLPASGSPILYPTALGQGNTQTSFAKQSFTTQIQVATGTSTHLNRTLNGCIVQSLSLATSIGEPLNCSADITFGKEQTADVAVGSAITSQRTGSGVDQGLTPYTFAHGEVKVHNGTQLTAVAEIQEFDISFAQNAELLYGLNSQTAIDAYRKVFDISGRFRATFKDKTLIQYVIDQSRAGTELIDSGVGITLIFTNGSKIIKIELNELSISDHNVSGIEPAEPVFEEINWACKSARISVTV